MMLADDYGLATLQPTLEQVGAITGTIDSLLPALESAPDLIARERQAVLETVDDYLEKTLAFVEDQRSILMQEEVRAEREAVLAALAEERAIVLAALADERRVVLEALHQERVDTFDDLESLVDGAVSRQLDRLFLKAFVLLVVLLAGLAIIAFLFARSVRTRGS
jgi:hypothetical protein